MCFYDLLGASYLSVKNWTCCSWDPCQFYFQVWPDFCDGNCGKFLSTQRVQASVRDKLEKFSSSSYFFFQSREKETSVLFHFKVMLVSFKKKQLFYSAFRSSHRGCSVKTNVLRNFAKFTGKHLCQSLFFNKVALGLQLY